MADQNEDWTCDIISRLHKIRINTYEFAEKCGYTPQYVSMVLNGKKTFASDEAKQQTVDRMFSCLKELENNC